jgi:hypothetical protein
MQNTVLAFLLALTSLVANAEIEKLYKPVVCSDLKTVIESISSEYNEVPYWNGISSDTKFILMVNKQTGTWTMIEYLNKDACVVGSGIRANLINLGKAT